MRGFLARLDEFASVVATYVPRDDSVLFRCVDELVDAVARGEKPPREPMWAPGR